ncbi:MAG: glycosyl hydrolase [Bacteroidota bacterium]
MKNILRSLSVSISLLAVLTIHPVWGQKSQKESSSTVNKVWEDLSLSGLKFRCIGPALTSGRISDFAINPQKPSEYYVATSSGGVWKTINAGTTFDPIFDAQGSYSIGCIAMDPYNPNVIWVGTGENNNQRSVAYGDGVYRSKDGGKSWKHMGLKASEHIGKILVHPADSRVIYVAAIGPLWSAGGDRGVFRSLDGGETWENVLEIDEHTGVTDLVMDPENPNVLYAAAYQRRRHVFTYLGGGPGSAIYKTEDGGNTWEKSSKGLPGVDLGRIGLAISPAHPEYIYAIVEAAEGKGGTYRSANRGASWEKRGGYSTSGNYYQEIIADPKNPEKLYAMNTWMAVSVNGGKSFSVVGEDFKHVDNHCLWIDPEFTDHLLVGCDGGIYETWDTGKTWDFKANLPITQFYKVAVDNAEPFYNVYGGTQDNFSLGGPSRVSTAHGITNADWFITHGGDGFESQVDPENPDIVYAQSQYGVLVRYDKRSGEEVGIQPKARKGENAYRWNWDAPLAVSPHAKGRLYFAANKVFRSDDYGNSWKVLGEDLTAQINRNELKVMDRVWGIDAVAKNRSTSPYGTIVAFAESPLNKDLLIVGTDDGLIQISENGGDSWRKISSIKGAPSQSYVNEVYASQHDENVIYAAFNHHKYGDFAPYVFKSTDKGQTWTSISSNLPPRGSVYALEEDHVDPNLLFVGTEFGVFFSSSTGASWKQLKAGLPTIAVRDIDIQRRENDLVLGTFGRGFYVLDDYTPLRSLEAEVLEKEAELFSIRDAWSFEKSMPLGLPGKSFQGDSYYSAENLGPEAMITYYMKDSWKSAKDLRKKAEQEARKDGGDVQYPSYEELKAENEAKSPQLLVTIHDAQGKVVRKFSKSPSKGVNRMKWDLRYVSKDPISFRSSSFYNPFAGKEEGTLVLPGTYSVTLSKVVDGEISPLAGPVSFEVKALQNTVLPAADRAAKVAFQQQASELARTVQGTSSRLSEAGDQLRYMKEAVNRAEIEQQALYAELYALEATLKGLRQKMSGDPIKRRLDIDQPPSIMNRVFSLAYEQFYSTAAPTQTHRDTYGIALEEFEPVLQEVNSFLEGDMETFKQKLEAAGAPYTPGRKVELGNN